MPTSHLLLEQELYSSQLKTLCQTQSLLTIDKLDFLHEILVSLNDLKGKLEEVSSDFSQLFGLDGGVATIVQELDITYVAHSIVEHNLEMAEVCHSLDVIRVSVTRLGDFWTFGIFLKPLATITLPKSPTFLGNFCKGVKIYHFTSEIIFGQLL